MQNCDCLESAVKVKNEQKEVEVFSGKQNEAVKSPAATNKDKELPKADFSKTSEYCQICYHHELSEVQY